ncbi:hypothetical protein D3C78_1663280 [compost metagenome]
MALPVRVSTPLAIAPSVLCSGRHQISPIGSALRKVSYIEASIEPWPPMLLASATLDTSTSLPTSVGAMLSLT